MTDPEISRNYQSPPGVLGEVRRTKPAEVVTLGPAEHALYSSGIRRGHCETLRQIAGQLREAAAAYRAKVAEAGGKRRTRAQLEELLESALAGYDSFAEQLDAPAREACKEQQQHLGRFLASKPQPGLVDRLGAAARGALGGWRGR